MPSALMPRRFCHEAMEAAKSLVIGSCLELRVFPIRRSYRYQPRCCLPPKVQVRSLRSVTFVVAAIANAEETEDVLTADVFLTVRGDCALTTTASAVTMTPICSFKVLNTVFSDARRRYYGSTPRE